MCLNYFSAASLFIYCIFQFANCRVIAALLGMGEESWSLVHNHLHKELTSWSEEYINLLGGIEKFEELKHSLLVDGLLVHKFIIMSVFLKITIM